MCSEIAVQLLQFGVHFYLMLIIRIWSSVEIIRSAIAWATLNQNQGVAGRGEIQLPGGGALRDEHGRCIEGFIRSIAQCDALHAELWAIMDDISSATARGFHSIELETDSTLDIRILSSPEQPTNVTIVRRIRAILRNH
ncbi:hypothetical protein F3Y22_tig00110831pilonHSYRG00796 [Hibiscus syriacus]|uniref:RNase H type-1 domain-containing protein n=1 Tax=Hibiscus syriacus TaxID=106335 RepID=A0A6A2ZM34_HIBSY|nr:hypothetical protein F3Y22_tig00110831pilonHSYRG00796 [Hibiscus syriacus]